MADDLVLGRVPIVFEKDFVDDERYSACIDGCSGGEEGFIQCAHCCFWFHVVCVKPKKPFKKGK